MEGDGFFLKYFTISLLMIIAGFGIRIYLKKMSLNDPSRVFGVTVYYLKFASKALIIFGILSFVIFLIALYFDLKYRGYL